MPEPFETESPPFAIGMVSLVLGVIALVFGFLPPLGIPLSGIGLLCGLIGIILVMFFHRAASLRWSLVGLVASGLALGVNVALLFAPVNFFPGRRIPKPRYLQPDRPVAPPPAPVSPKTASLRIMTPGIFRLDEMESRT